MANSAKVTAKKKAREDAAFFEAAGISFRPSWKQHLAWMALEDDTTEEVMYGGAAGGGKSFLGASWKVYRRLRYPGSRGVTARTRLIDIKESTLVTYFKVLAAWGLVMGQDYRYVSRSGAPEALVFKNGSREIFKELAYSPSDEDYQRLGSLEITDCWIEEANDGVPEKGADIIKSRIRWMLADFNLIPKILITCNPGYTWVRLKYVYDADNNPVVLKPYQRVIQALVTDNPDREFVRIYKKSLEQLKDYDRQRLLEGDWNAVEKTGGEFYPSFDTQLHVGDYASTYDADLPLHITLDFNLTPGVTLNVWQVRGKEATQVDEFTQDGKTSLACQRFVRKYGQHNAEVFVYGDPAGKHGDTRTEQGSNDFTIVVKELRKMPRVTLRVEASAPSVSMRGMWIDDILAHEESGIRLRFDRKCNVTSTDYQKVKKASDGTKDKKKVTNPTTKVSYEPYGHCFVGETLITTRRGQVPIADVRPGDDALTRKGYRRVLRLWRNGTRSVETFGIGNTLITCTPDHHFFTQEHGFIAVGHLTQPTTFCIFDEQTHQLCNEKRLFTRVPGFTATPTLPAAPTGCTSTAGLSSTGSAKKSVCTGCSGCKPMGLYPRATTFTTKTTTRSITRWITSCALKTWNTFASMGLMPLPNSRPKGPQPSPPWPKSVPKNGTAATKAGPGTANTPLKPKGLSGLLRALSATLRQPWLASKKPNSAPINAGCAITPASCVPAEASRREVFDLLIEGEHEYFANGILVHNCTDANDYFLCRCFQNEWRAYQRAGSSRPKMGDRSETTQRAW